MSYAGSADARGVRRGTAKWNVHPGTCHESRAPPRHVSIENFWHIEGDFLHFYSSKIVLRYSKTFLQPQSRFIRLYSSFLLLVFRVTFNIFSLEDKKWKKWLRNGKKIHNETKIDTRSRIGEPWTIGHYSRSGAAFVSLWLFIHEPLTIATKRIPCRFSSSLSFFPSLSFLFFHFSPLTQGGKQIIDQRSSITPINLPPWIFHFAHFLDKSSNRIATFVHPATNFKPL